MRGAGLLRLPEGVYDAELLALYGLEDAQAQAAAICSQPTDIVGRVTAEAAAATGLAEGTPVVAGYFDVVASASAPAPSRRARPPSSSAPGDQPGLLPAPVVDPSVFMVARFGPGRFVNIESSATSAANLEWYVREFVERGGHHDDPFGHCNAAVGAVAPALDDPLFHPFLYGSRTGAHHARRLLRPRRLAREGHLLRALFEGVMFEHRRHIDVLTNGRRQLRQRRAVGRRLAQRASGRRCSPTASACRSPSPHARETGALGAAIGAGVGAGLFADYEAGVRRHDPAKRRLSPDPAMRRPLRQALSRLLRRSTDALRSALGRTGRSDASRTPQ